MKLSEILNQSQNIPSSQQFENLRNQEIQQKTIARDAQAAFQRIKQKQEADPTNWSSSKLKEYYKENPPQTVQEQAQANAAMEMKKQQEKRLTDQMLGRSSDQENEPKNSVTRVAAAGPAGTMVKPEDVPGLVADFINGLSQGTLKRNLAYPQGGGAFAEGANLPHDLTQMVSDFTGGKTPVAPRGGPTPSDLPNIVLPEPVSPGGQIAGSMLEAGGYMLEPQVAGVAEMINRSPTRAQALQKAEKLTTEIFQPSKGDLQSAFERGLGYKPVQTAAKYIKQSKNYGDLQSRIEGVMNAKMNERNYLIKRYNRPVGKTYLNDLQKYIVEQRRIGQIPPNELKTMEEVLQKEAGWASRQRKLNTLKAEERKEELQRMTQSLMERRADGVDVSRDPARTRALDILRSGLKRKIEISHPQIQRNNADWASLNQAKELIAGQRALAEKAVPQNILQRIFNMLLNPKDIPAEVARAAFQRESDLPRVTAKIERLMRQAG